MSRDYTPDLFISPEWDEALKAALWESVRLELAEADLLDEVPEEAFSFRYQKRKEQIIPMAERRYISFGNRTVRRAALLSAVLVLIFAMSAVVLAFMLPTIHYEIRKGSIDWQVDFHQEDPDNMMPERFVYIEPEAPPGFHKSDEYRDETRSIIRYEDETGNRIHFEQHSSVGVRAYLDAEGEYIEEKVINGRRCIVMTDGGKSMVLFDNGYYIFGIDGDCELDVLEGMMKEVLDKTDREGVSANP